MTSAQQLPSFTPDPALAAAAGAGVLAWYAMPDVVRSRPARLVLKGLLLAGGTVAYAWTRPETPSTNGPDGTDQLFHAVNEHPGRAAIIGGAVLAASTAATVWGEKAIFRFGEKRRARGVRFAHTLPALGWASLGAAAMVLDRPAAPRVA